jgi:AcrR family transcriptional regulator
MARKANPNAREHILDVAARLFAERGVHAVGMQQIIDEFGCGKNLLYREFGSKDDLIVAYLRRCAEHWTAIVDRACAAAPDDPPRQLVELVTAVAEEAAATGYRGCPLRNVYAEFPDPTHPANRAVVDFYQARMTFLHHLASQTNAPDPQVLAARINLLIDGIDASTPVLGPTTTTAARAFAEEAVTTATRR